MTTTLPSLSPSSPTLRLPHSVLFHVTLSQFKNIELTFTTQDKVMAIIKNNMFFLEEFPCAFKLFDHFQGMKVVLKRLDAEQTRQELSLNLLRNNSSNKFS